MDKLYSADQIQVPAELPSILKAYTKEVIRYNPKDIVAFSRDYFASLANKELDRFLAEHEKMKLQAEEQAAREKGFAY